MPCVFVLIGAFFLILLYRTRKGEEKKWRRRWWAAKSGVERIDEGEQKGLGDCDLEPHVSSFHPLPPTKCTGNASGTHG